MCRRATPRASIPCKRCVRTDTGWEPLGVGRHYSRRTRTERPVSFPTLSEPRDAARRAKKFGLPLVAASADQRGFLVIYERPGSQLNIADVYELVGMAVVG